MATVTNPRLTRTAQPKDGLLSSSIQNSAEQFNQVAEHLVKNGDACLPNISKSPYLIEEDA